MTLPPATGANRRTSLRTLFVLGHVPLWCFALGITVVSFEVLSMVDEQVRTATAVAGQTPAERQAIEHMGHSFKSLWQACLAAFFAFVALGSALVAWTHRTLSRRIDRIVGHARRIGAGVVDDVIQMEANDALGKLEDALAQVAQALGHRDAARRADHEARDQLARVQRALGMIDTEADAHRIVHRALRQMLPHVPAQMLMADSSQAHLREVLATGASAGGCGVESPARCPAVQRGGPLVFTDSEAIDACPRLGGREPACSAGCLPVTVMGRAVGVLHVTRPHGIGFDVKEMASLEALVAAVGSRTGALRTLEMTQLQAGTDGLTGLLNRRSFETKAAALLAASPRLAVAMADLDHFKRLNDTHGHAAGDRALRAFAQVLRATLRPGDLVARWGGEEFCLILAECSGEEARIALDRVREASARQAGEGGAPTCTASFGVAEFTRDGLDLDTLVQAADGALYQAKQQGRDRVVVRGEVVVLAAAV